MSPKTATPQMRSAFQGDGPGHRVKDAIREYFTPRVADATGEDHTLPTPRHTVRSFHEQRPRKLGESRRRLRGYENTAAARMVANPTITVDFGPLAAACPAVFTPAALTAFADHLHATGVVPEDVEVLVSPYSERGTVLAFVFPRDTYAPGLWDDVAIPGLAA